MEFRLRHKDGHYVHVLSRGFPVRREPGGPVVRIVGTHFDLTERKQAEEARERERSERARTELLGRMVFAQEDERRRIAREMHDQFGEQLTALGLRIRMLKEAAAGRADLSAQVEALEQVAQQLDRDVDHLVWELRPTALDDLGLRAALANYIQDWSLRVRVPAELHTAGLTTDRLGSEIETTLYRIAQEALNNIAKHARGRPRRDHPRAQGRSGLARSSRMMASDSIRRRWTPTGAGSGCWACRSAPRSSARPCKSNPRPARARPSLYAMPATPH